MPLKIKEKIKAKIHYRHLEEVPFYKIHHSFDELPLDPVKPFIIEKIRKLKKLHVPIKLLSQTTFFWKSRKS